MYVLRSLLTTCLLVAASCCSCVNASEEVVKKLDLREGILYIDTLEANETSSAFGCCYAVDKLAFGQLTLVQSLNFLPLMASGRVSVGKHHLSALYVLWCY